MSNTPKRHHFLPQFYLRGFCNSSGRLWLYDWARAEYRCQQPGKVGHERHLYTLCTKDGRDVSIEMMLSSIEGMARPVIERIDRKERLTQSDRDIVGVFAALMYARVPRFRDKVIGNLKRVVTEDKLSINERSSLAGAPGEESFRQIYFVRKMLDIAREYAPEFRVMHWIIARAPEGKTFVTSDDPVTPTAGESYDGPLEDIRLTTPSIGKMLPLTMKSSLVILDHGTKTEYWDVDADFVRKMNCNQAFTSTRLLIGRDKSLLASLVKEAVPVRKRIAVELAS